jgi:hypothetical protein
MSRLVTVRFGDLVVHADFAVAAMRWEAAGPGGGLFPALDADIKLTRAGQDVTVSRCRVLTGRLWVRWARGRPRDHAPGRPGNYPAFTQHVGTAIVSPAASPEAAYTRRLPEHTAWPEPETP